MPHQPLRPAPPPPHQHYRKPNNNHLLILQGGQGGVTNDNNNNQQQLKSSTNTAVVVAAPARPQKKVPPPRPAPPKRLPASYHEARSTGLKKKNNSSGGSRANGVRSGLSTYFNLKTGRARATTANGHQQQHRASTRHSKRKAPPPPPLSGGANDNDAADSLIDFNSPPPTPRQRCQLQLQQQQNEALSLLDLDLDVAGVSSHQSHGEIVSLLDLDLADLEAPQRCPPSSASTAEFSIFTCPRRTTSSSNAAHEVLSMGPVAWTAMRDVSVSNKSTLDDETALFRSYIKGPRSGDDAVTTMTTSHFKKPTIIRPSGNDSRHDQSARSSSSKPVQELVVDVERSGEGMSPSPGNNRFELPRTMSSSSEGSEDSSSPPEPQFPPPVLPSANELDETNKASSDGEQWCRALFDFRGENDDELTFSEGDYIRIEDFVNLDWMIGSLHGKVGTIPISFVELVQGLPPPPAWHGDEQHKSSPNVPFRVTALYTFDSQVPGDLNFKEGDVIEVTRKINDDWWYGKLLLPSSDSREGQFPSNFVAANRGTSRSFSNAQYSGGIVGRLYRAVYSFEGEVSGDLAFVEGDVIQVTEASNADWWRGKLVNDPFDKQGIFPRAFVEPLSS